MTRRIDIAFALVLAACCGAAPALASQAPESVNLLREADRQLQFGEGADIPLDALADGDPGTSAELPSPQGAPVEIRLSFGDETVTVQQLVVQLSPGSEAASAPSSVEILVSNADTPSGFHVVRSDPLEVSPERQPFDFRPHGARWILIRLHPREGATTFQLAELELVGHRGPPMTVYEFKQAPADAFTVLAQLGNSTLDVSLTADEANLFADAADGTLDQWSFAAAALLASGVHDAQAREAYLARLAELESRAKRALDSIKDPFARAEKLLQLLHEAALAGGYEAEQTDLSTILDSGKFNCVSSAAIFNVIGRRLGLDLRAIEVPDHAFSILYAGSRHADVETTTEAGFNPARDQASAAALEATTGYRYIPDSHRDQRRELGEAGLVAIIYYNHGVTLGRQGRHVEALMSYFRALSLDGENQSAVKNVLAELVNWSGDLDEAGQFEEAAQVVRIGLELAPQDDYLRHQHLRISCDWAEALHKSGRTAEALAALDEAARQVPDNQDEFTARKAYLFIAGGEALIDEGRWDEALAVVAPGLEQLEGEALEELVEWRATFHRRWSHYHIDSGRFAEAVDVLERGMADGPQRRELVWSLQYAVQEWAEHVLNAEGRPAADQLLISLLDRFPGVDDVSEVALNHVRRDVIGLRDASRFDEALEAIQAHQPLLARVGDDDELVELTSDLYISRSREHMDRGEWPLAVDVMSQALETLQGEGGIADRLAYVIQEWADHVLQTQGRAAADELLVSLVDRFPAVDDVPEVALNHVRRDVIALRDASRFDEALEAIKEHQQLLSRVGDDDEAEELTFDLVVGHSRELMDRGDWAGAVDVVQAAFTLVKDEREVNNRLAYVIQEWVRTVFENGGEEAAHEVLLPLARRFSAVRDVGDVIEGHVRRVIRELAESGKFEEGVAACERHRELLGLLEDEDRAHNAIEVAYDAWGQDLMDKKEWDDAIRVYRKGLEAFPESSLFQQNVRYCEQERDR